MKEYLNDETDHMKHFMKRRDKKPILLKCTGGKAAQVCAVMCAIYLKNRIKRPFQIIFYPYSTGTFWEFAIYEILREDEIHSIKLITTVTSPSGNGEVIDKFHHWQYGINRISIYRLLQHFGLLNFIRSMRKEISIGGYANRLNKVRSSTRFVSGNFPPIDDGEVLLELEKRFPTSLSVNPFARVKLKEDITIHYRLGDMRLLSKGSSESSTRVVDPVVFVQVLLNLNKNLDTVNVKVVSDEPKIAKMLLNEVGIRNVAIKAKPDFWSDLADMAQSTVLIGSLSQMSLLGGVLCLRNGGLVFVPSDAHGEGNLAEGLGIARFRFIPFTYLNSDHWLFSL